MIALRIAAVVSDAARGQLIVIFVGLRGATLNVGPGRATISLGAVPIRVPVGLA